MAAGLIGVTAQGSCAAFVRTAVRSSIEGSPDDKAAQQRQFGRARHVKARARGVRFTGYSGRLPLVEFLRSRRDPRHDHHDKSVDEIRQRPADGRAAFIRHRWSLAIAEGDTTADEVIPYTESRPAPPRTIARTQQNLCPSSTPTVSQCRHEFCSQSGTGSRVRFKTSSSNPPHRAARK